jgi:hypothetical protein
VLRAALVMDSEQLHKDILSALPSDPYASQLLANTLSPRWSKDPEGYLRCDGRIYVPEANDLRLRILRYHHDHPLAGHFGQNRTLELIRRDYTWPAIRTFVKDYVKSCTTCARAKTPRHKPYGTLKQLPIPEKPWNSISMDFIEQLPDSAGFTAILVVIDRLSKQGIFIPTYDTITSPELAKLFLLHVFSKHGVPAHVTSDRGTEFVSHFFHSLGKALDIRDKPNELIKPSSSTFAYIATTSRTTGPSFYPSQNSPTTMLLAQLPECLCSSPIRVTTLIFLSTQNAI